MLIISLRGVNSEFCSHLHDRTEKWCTVPYKALLGNKHLPLSHSKPQETFLSFVWDNGKYLQCMIFSSCHGCFEENGHEGLILGFA